MFDTDMEFYEQYHQKGGIYVMPVEVFEELLNESTELKKQLEEYKDKINWYENFEVNKTIDKLRLKHNNQQQEFIKYLEKEIVDCRAGSGQQYYAQEHLKMFKETIGAENGK